MKPFKISLLKHSFKKFYTLSCESEEHHNKYLYYVNFYSIKELQDARIFENLNGEWQPYSNPKEPEEFYFVYEKTLQKSYENYSKGILKDFIKEIKLKFPEEFV